MSRPLVSPSKTQHNTSHTQHNTSHTHPHNLHIHVDGVTQNKGPHAHDKGPHDVGKLLVGDAHGSMSVWETLMQEMQVCVGARARVCVYV